VAIRVGIDLVRVDSVADSVREHAERYLQRVFTERELADCQTDAGLSCERLASRFAAKEATIKVLRPGNRSLPWRNIEVRRDPTGWVDLELSGSAASLATEAGLAEFALSLTHEHGVAAAVVVAESMH